MFHIYPATRRRNWEGLRETISPFKGKRATISSAFLDMRHQPHPLRQTVLIELGPNVHWALRTLGIGIDLAP